MILWVHNLQYYNLIAFRRLKIYSNVHLKKLKQQHSIRILQNFDTKLHKAKCLAQNDPYHPVAAIVIALCS